MRHQLIIIGGGAAGLSAARAAQDKDIDIHLIERNPELGGILNQCIHTGFGLEVFKEELTGPEYAQRFIDQLDTKHIHVRLSTTVIDIWKDDRFHVTISSVNDGIKTLDADAVILTTGCYERTRGALSIPGERPKGIMTAGLAQKYLNIHGYLVGKKVFILGSGDIGLIMARRMTLEGATVLGVAEIMPYANGLNRNLVQCLDDFDIPLYLSHTVTKIYGKKSLSSIEISKVDDQLQPIPGTEKTFDVDTLLLSVGLIPDIALFDRLIYDKDPLTKSALVNQRYETSMGGLFVCGNALHVHDLVDWVSLESTRAGHAAKAWLLDQPTIKPNLTKVSFDDKIRYVVPQVIDMTYVNEDVHMMFRVNQKMSSATIEIIQKDQIIVKTKKKHLVPSEMVSVVIAKDRWVSVDPIHIKLSEVI